MKNANWRPTKPTLFTILMIVAGISCMLPARWTSCFNGVTQPLSPVSGMIADGVRETRELTGGLASESLSPEEIEALTLENERLKLQAGHQDALIAEMEGIIDDLSGLRDQLSQTNARLIFATVIGGETSPARETLTISKGARHGVREGDWVASGIPLDQRNPAATGRQLLMKQWLIGIVVEAQPYVSRVQLATDPSFSVNMKCTIAKPVAEGKLATAAAECRLEGVGGGRMRIDQAYQDYYADGFTIVLAPLTRSRPISLTIGRIVKSRSLETGLHFELEVTPWGDARELTNVYVISEAD